MKRTNMAPAMASPRTKADAALGRAVAQVDALTWAGQPQRALEQAAALLARDDLPAAQRAWLLDLRAECCYLRADMPALRQALAELKALARRNSNAKAHVRARCRES